ncbi:MAG: YdiU family protein [Planctomycetia bacterium]
MPAARTLAAAGWRFDNSYARLPEPFFSRATPVSVRSPQLVALNEPLAAELGLDAAVLREAGAALFAGNEVPPGAEPIAQAYAGHQFGHFTNLGDGRAILLGEQLTPDGRRFDVQLKGAGHTRYSRSGDGRAALGPMLREYLVSEGMHALGVPTSRSLAVAATGEAVLRERALPGAVLTRVAASHIRVGTFEYAAALGDPSLLPSLLDHAIARHYPQVVAADDKAAAFLDAVIERQAALIAQWMLVGFVHGVMNTDNMAVSGETIDYGPCAFLDTYDPATTFSSIDRDGRYASGNQPGIAHWNLARLAESLLPLMPGDEAAALEAAKTAISTFPARFERHHLAGARAKLGLVTEEQGDRELFLSLLRWMHETGADFTATFADLAMQAEVDAPAPCGAGGEAFAAWCTQWRARLARQPGSPTDAAARMRRVNPLVIPRNHHVEEALAAAEAGDLAPFERLLAAIRRPFDDTPANEPYRAGPPAGCGPYRTFCGT